MMKNAQPPEKNDHRDARWLDVVAIWPTIQGEGPFTGTPATFIRLAGCNLQCPLCDTNYTANRQKEAFTSINRTVLSFNNQLVVITGGEPFRQNITELCRLLLEQGLLVQVETNGTICPTESFHRLKGEVNSTSCRLCVVCSPKTSKISPTMGSLVDAWKYVVKDGEVEEDGMPSSALGMAGRPARPINDQQIYIQPLDSKDPEENQAHMKAAVESCLKNGHRLCLQLHKIAGLE